MRFPCFHHPTHDEFSEDAHAIEDGRQLRFAFARSAQRGHLDVVATQDWDALLYGSPVLVRNLMADGTKRYGRTVYAERINLDAMRAELDLSQEQLVDLGIMIGTDRALSTLSVV